MTPSELLLRNLSRHASFLPAERALIAAAFTPVAYSRREVLLREGDVANHTYYVADGCVRLYYRHEAGTVHVLQFATEDWWVTDLHSYLNAEPSRLCIDALENSLVLQAPHDLFNELLQAVPALDRAFRILAQRGMAAMQQRIVDSMSQSALERYLSFRRQYGVLESRLPQNQIASFIGVTPEFLSTLRRRLARGEGNPKPDDLKAIPGNRTAE